MKKVFLFLIILLLVTGCGKVNGKDVINNIEKKLDKSLGYKLNGKLVVSNNDEVYNYDVLVSYKKPNYYKVELTNTSNDHTQIILKNKKGVYLLTPSLNKSFRFQSDWPYDNSQVYLINTLINDMNKKSTFKIDKDKYYFKTKVNYPNNSKLVNQSIILDKNFKFKKVSVYDKDGVEVMSMKFDKIDYSPKFKKNEFDIDNVINSKTDEVLETGNLDDVIYPLFVPNGTKLVDEEKIDKTNGMRVIMNYDGEKSFLLVEETAEVFDEFTIIPSMGELYFLQDTLGVVNDNSLSWTSGGVDFYLTSDNLTQPELFEIAESVIGTLSTK